MCVSMCTCELYGISAKVSLGNLIYLKNVYMYFLALFNKVFRCKNHLKGKRDETKLGVNCTKLGVNCTKLGVNFVKIRS